MAGSSPLMRGVRIDGRQFMVHPPGDWLSDRLMSLRTWHEAAIIRHAIGLLAGRSGVIIDAGANIGNHTVPWALALPDVAVHAFEPYPPNYRLLVENARTLRNVITHPFGLSDHHERNVPMGVDPTNLGHAVVTATDPWPQEGMITFAADMVTLDALAISDVLLMKLDVEWHEPQVVAGAQATIETWRPHIIVEDWKHEYAALFPGYRLAAEWETAHQTFLYSPA